MSLIFKMGKKEYSGNYRLVSLTLVPGKTMEKLILETNFYTHVEQGNQKYPTWIYKGESMLNQHDGLVQRGD